MTVIVAVALSCSTAHATLMIYQQDFSTDPRISSQDSLGYVPLGVTGSEYDYEDWVYHSPISYSGSNENLTLKTSGNKGVNDATRGAGFALDGTSFLAGDYSLTFDVVADNPEGIGVGVYAMNFGGSRAYGIDTVAGPGGWLPPNTGDGTNTITFSSNQTFLGTGTKTINFSVGDDGQDLIFVFQARSTQATQRSTTIDNVIVSTTAVPEPSTFSLMGLGLAGFGWLLRRRKQKAILAIQED